MTFANAGQLPTVYAMAISHFGRHCANLETIIRVFEHNTCCILVIGRAESDPVDSVHGYCAVLWLNALGVARLLDGTLDTTIPDLDCIVPQGVRPSAAYVWAVVAMGKAAGALHRVIEFAQATPIATLDIYTRPSTPSGLRLARTLGFAAIAPTSGGNQPLYVHRNSDERRRVPAAVRSDAKPS